jgi:hypothetical protein
MFALRCKPWTSALAAGSSIFAALPDLQPPLPDPQRAAIERRGSRGLAPGPSAALRPPREEPLMLKLTALLTTLALGSAASIAMASPTRSYDRDGRFGPAGPVAPAWTAPSAPPARPAWIDRHRIDPAYDGPARLDRPYRRGAVEDLDPRRYRPTWVALSAPSPLIRAEDCIEVHDRGTFTQLRVQADDSRARVDRVVVQFADGSRQIEDLDRVLGGRSDFVDIPLDGNNRRIDRIFVTGSTGRRGAVQVFGI